MYPTNYNEFKVEEWLQIARINPLNYKDNEEYYNEVMDTFFRSHDLDPEKMDMEDVVRASFIFQPPKPKQTPKGIGEYRFMDYKKANISDFIDMESNYSKGVDGWLRALAVITRLERVNKWGQVTNEPREYSLQERSEVIRGMSVADFVAKRNELAGYLNDRIKRFKPIFEIDDEDEREDEPTDTEKLHAAFKWNKFIFFAADFDVTKMEKVLKMNADLLFTTLSMQKILKIYPKS